VLFKINKFLISFLHRFLDSYKANGVDFWGITVENEPGSHTINSMELDPKMERDFVKLDLGPALAKAGYGRDKLNLMTFDDGGGHPIVEWMDTVFNDIEAKKYYHGLYENNIK